MENSLGEFVYFNKKKIFIAILLLIIFLGLIGYYFYKYEFQDDEELEDNSAIEEVEKVEVVDEEKEEKEVIKNCYFDIKGEIKKPGVYSITCDKRVVDAISLAGGLTKNSDTSVLNLSRKIEDGMVIIIYSKNEVKKYLETLEKEEKKQNICSEGTIVNDACIDNENNNKKDDATTNGLINLNKATLEELMTLPGIGEAKAKNIIAYREKTPFKTIDELLNVEGIGESLYASIKKNITV